MRVEDLHLDSDPPELCLVDAKGGASRYMPILPSLAQELRTHLQARRHSIATILLPAHIHYGVADTEAIELLSHGVRSRRLAVAVGQKAAADGIAIVELRKWLGDLGAPAGRDEFAAGTDRGR